MKARSAVRQIIFAAAVAAWAVFTVHRAPALGLLVPDDVQYEPLELESQIMEAKIDNQTAQTKIKQTFFNRYGRPIEATYLLPVPKGAQVTDFAMEMSGKKVRGEVLEKEKARQIYTDIVRRVKDPGLLEYVDQEIFRARVFPIPPNGRQQVEITVTHLLPLDNGIVEYAWPLDAPRGVKQRGRPASAGEFDLKLDITSKIPIQTVYCPTHKVRIEKDGDKRAVVRLDEQPSAAEPIFKCYYTLSDKAVGINVLTTMPEGEDGTFLLLITPGRFQDDKQLPPVDFTFVFDSSGSMGDDDKIGAAKKALKYCLNSLRSVDAFNIIRFSTEVEPFAETFLEANEANINRAKSFVDGLRAAGGTNIDGALAAALKQKPRPDRLHTILFLTDGLPTVGATNVDQILANVEKNNEARLRVFACGVGYDVNTKLLDRLAEKTRAVVQYIRPKEDLEVAVSQLFDKISRPVLTDLRIDWGDLKVRDVYPKDLPDLFAGTQLTVFGRYKNGGDRAITLFGKVGGEEKKFVYEAKFPDTPHDERAFVQTLWATRRVGYLLDQIRINGESKELKDEVIALAKRHGIVTPYTSYLVQEDQPRPVAGGGIQPEPMYELHRGAAGVTPDGRTAYNFGAADRAEAKTDVFPAPLPPPSAAVAQEGQAGRRGARAFVQAEAAAPLTALRSMPAGGVGGAAPVTGQAAVDYSLALRDLKSADRMSEAVAPVVGTRAVAGKTFVLVNGVWTELREKKDSVGAKKTLKIKYLSDAYFELVRLRPDLKSVFALGERIEMDINNVRVVIGPEGEERMPREQLDELRKK
ncbi:MAG: VIT and VWA domain-containing protein [Candidatus Sumerlaeia bacterium]|nr:VIT and VWA domain-containing protein [Candidatus Sumerlaeia bacterium]